MSSNFVVPPVIEAVIQEFEHTETPFTESDVQQALSKARASLQNPTEAENFGSWAEALAFTLVGSQIDASPWGTFFSPMGSGTDENGNAAYFPDIADADAQVIAHWTDRAITVQHPVLKARYADLVWDMCKVIAGENRDPEMARLAIDAYLASGAPTILPGSYERLEAALRALDLACLIQDQKRIDRARSFLMDLHRGTIRAREGLWWLSFDRLIQEKNAGVTDAERNELVGSLEELILHYGETTKPDHFNPHLLQDAAMRLIRHYTRLQQFDDVKRLHTAIAQAFEHFAGLSDAMVASAVLQTAVNAYRDAGLSEDSKRVRILMQEKIGQAREQMVPIETEIKISREDMEKFLAALVVEDLKSTLVRIAVEFLPNKHETEEQLRKTLKDTPLTALMTQLVMADDHVAAKVGSVEDDLTGRLLQQVNMNLGISDIWLYQALRKTVEFHNALPEHFASWANRLGIFEDVAFILEGVRAWYDGDLVKAVHVLVPQMERGLRGIVAQLGRPVTKAHPAVADVSVALSMGDIVFSQEITDELGPDLTLYFRALYADPRGLNLRNDTAHGLINSDAVSGHMVRLLIHTLLVFGVWKELAERGSSNGTK